MLPRTKKDTPKGVFFGGGAKVGRRSLSSLGGCATANYRLRSSGMFRFWHLALNVLYIDYTHLDGRGSRLAATHEKRHPEGVFFGGGAKGTRTPDLCVANASLYQLSYNPTRVRRVCAVIEIFGRFRLRLRSGKIGSGGRNRRTERVVEVIGLEPMTSCM